MADYETIVRGPKFNFSIGVTLSDPVEGFTIFGEEEPRTFSADVWLCSDNGVKYNRLAFVKDQPVRSNTTIPIPVEAFMTHHLRVGNKWVETLPFRVVTAEPNNLALRQMEHGNQVLLLPTTTHGHDDAFAEDSGAEATTTSDRVKTWAQGVWNHVATRPYVRVGVVVALVVATAAVGARFVRQKK